MKSNTPVVIQAKTLIRLRDLNEGLGGIDTLFRSSQKPKWKDNHVKDLHIGE